VHAEIPMIFNEHTRSGISQNDVVIMSIIPVKVALRGSPKCIETYDLLDPGTNVGNSD